MPGTVDDFMQRFGSGGTMDESQVAQYHDRFVSTHADDKDFDRDTYHQAASKYLGQLPDDQFHDAARNALNQAPPQERAGILSSVMNALGGAGGAAGGLGGLAGMLGLGSTDPNRMNGDDAAKVLNYARTKQPGALQQAVAEKPWFMKALGNPIVLGALTMAATRMLSQRRA